MYVLKFGGASLCNVLNIKKIGKIIVDYKKQPLTIVFSAMDKVTQWLEDAFNNKTQALPYEKTLTHLYSFHLQIIQALFSSKVRQQHMLRLLLNWHKSLKAHLAQTIPILEIEKHYSHFVAYGEIISSHIMYHYLQEIGVPCKWLDVRHYLKTKNGFVNALLDEELTSTSIRKDLALYTNHIIVTQGFIASNDKGETTTLGKEGSDFTGAIFAAALQADGLIVWKNIPGIMNADPEFFDQAILFNQLSYEEMAIMSHYGAQVIHPKTIEPLRKAGIKLYVKSFFDQTGKGTCISRIASDITTPIYVVRKKQLVLNLIGYKSMMEFMPEEGLQKVLALLTTYHIAPLHFSHIIDSSVTIAINQDHIQLTAFLETLRNIFQVKMYKNANILTILNWQPAIALPWLKDKNILAIHYDENIHQIIFV